MKKLRHCHSVTDSGNGQVLYATLYEYSLCMTATRGITAVVGEILLGQLSVLSGSWDIFKTSIADQPKGQPSLIFKAEEEGKGKGKGDDCAMYLPDDVTLEYRYRRHAVSATSKLLRATITRNRVLSTHNVATCRHSFRLCFRRS